MYFLYGTRQKTPQAEVNYAEANYTNASVPQEAKPLELIQSAAVVHAPYAYRVTDD